MYCEDKRKLNIKTELHVTELAWGPFSRNIGRVLFLRAYEPDELQSTLYTLEKKHQTNILHYGPNRLFIIVILKSADKLMRPRDQFSVKP